MKKIENYFKNFNYNNARFFIIIFSFLYLKLNFQRKNEK